MRSGLGGRRWTGGISRVEVAHQSCGGSSIAIISVMNKAKLTRNDLSAIWLRNPESNDVPTLLQEVNRLRGIALRADQLIRALGPMGGMQGMMAVSLRAELEGEPCVAEFLRMDPD